MLTPLPSEDFDPSSRHWETKGVRTTHSPCWQQFIVAPSPPHWPMRGAHIAPFCPVKAPFDAPVTPEPELGIPEFGAIISEGISVGFIVGIIVGLSVGIMV